MQVGLPVFEPVDLTLAMLIREGERLEQEQQMVLVCMCVCTYVCLCLRVCL